MSLVQPVFLAFIALAVVTLIPLVFVLRRPAPLQGRRETAIALHRAQLAELDRELAEGRIGAPEHGAAKLEIQRRLLAAASLQDSAGRKGGVAALLVVVLLVPILAEGLYLIDGHPELPDQPAAARQQEAALAAQDADRLIATLRVRLAQMDPKADITREGQILLGNAEASRGHMAEAAAAWRAALAIRFDATLAAQAAEAQYQADQKLTPDTEALFRKALAAAPPDAPWRPLVQQRLGG